MGERAVRKILTFTLAESTKQGGPYGASLASRNERGMLRR
jgi:hypothetical protein